MNVISLRFIKLITVGLSVFIFLGQVPAEATIYKWRDKDGKTHFTDDPAKASPKYRDKLQKQKELPSTSPPPIPKPVVRKNTPKTRPQVLPRPRKAASPKRSSSSSGSRSRY